MMKYKELYVNSKNAVRQEIKALWCGSPQTASQKKYKAKLDALMDDIFAPSYAFPLVESMSDYLATSQPANVYSQYVTPAGKQSLWTRTDPPYEHQVQCWENLSNGNSIVVTTGTGSGKTECFMLPIAKDIIDNLATNRGCVQAIFLYPLNALMEDQKLRLLKVLEGSDARFAIYNGTCPENEGELIDIVRKTVNENPRCGRLELAKLAAKRILGCSSDAKLATLDCWANFERKASNITCLPDDKNFAKTVVACLDEFKNIVLTRDAIRAHNNHPEIILTNSSMIEYSLLRTSDYCIYSESAGSLKWFAIDETHTYSGAGAIELAMQLKRLLNAYGVNSRNVRFATSSATVGNNTNDLENFIEKLTGNRPVVVSGSRQHLPGYLTDPIIGALDASASGYVRLDDLISEGDNVEEKLEILDSTIDSFNNDPANIRKVKVKVHFFFRVLNRGLKVCLSDIDSSNDCFNIHLDVPAHLPTDDTEPYLELARCSSCGGYIAIGQYQDTPGQDHVFRSNQSYTDSLFSLDSAGNDAAFDTAVFAYVDTSKALGAGEAFISVKKNTFKPYRPLTPSAIVFNSQCSCPHCGKSLKSDAADEETGDVDKIKTFRLSSTGIGQIISPAVLGQMMMTGNNADPHQGQQYLSFVDSRKDAAKATLEQNLKVKRDYVYQLVYNKLVNLQTVNASVIASKQNELQTLRAESELLRQNGDFQGAYSVDGRCMVLMADIRNLENSCIPFDEIIQDLSTDERVKLLFEQSVDDNDIMHFAGLATPTVAEKQAALKKLFSSFVHGLAYELLAKRHLRGCSPESMGLFCSTYPKIDSIPDKASLPAGVVDFNNHVANTNDKISGKDWKDLLTIAVNQSRSNESMFIKYDDPSGAYSIDIHSCRRFATGDSSRKSINIKELDPTKNGYPHYAYLLADLLSSSADKKKIIRENLGIINGVISDINSTLRNIGIAEVGQVLSNGQWKDEADDDGLIYRLNVSNIAFKLFGQVDFCKVVGLDAPRPTAVMFKSRSPFYDYGTINASQKHEDWRTTYQTSFASLADLHDWAARNRPQIWKTLWDNDGLFSSRLDTLYMYDADRDFYVQAEHTAQIDKSLSRQYQSLFQEHKINILACSTTMEMGVDLGDLELVMMNSVPPAPSNYKQRAGRSGRGHNIYKSAAVTLCGSDSLGARTLRDPYGMIIGRTIQAPVVLFDENRRIIQRHLNAYCFRRVLFDFWLPNHPNTNAVSLSIRQFYTNFEYECDSMPGGRSITRYDKIIYVGRGLRFLPETNRPLGDITNTMYDFFEKNLPVIPIGDCDFLLSVLSNYQTDRQALFQRVSTMLNDTLAQAQDVAISVGSSFEDYCRVKGWDPTDPAQLNTINKDDRLSGITRSLSKFLEGSLIDYLATSRFTPNANMPVDVLEFDVNYSSNSWINNKKSNPSYQLREALSQYSPGNRVVLKNAVYSVGGVSIKGKHRAIADLDVLLHSNFGRISKTETAVSLIPGESWQPWDGHSNKLLMVLRPYAFLPDQDKDQKTRARAVGIVKSQLVGVDIWQPPLTQSMLDSRSSVQLPESRILYYNDGYGYGFSYCRRCGRAVPEGPTFDHKQNRDFISVINNRESVINGANVPYHNYLRLNSNRCSTAKDQVDNRVKAHKTTILRHAVIGDYIQTDFTEFRFFWNDGTEVKDEKFLNAMGVLFCQAYSEYAPIERRDIDFTITADGHLCIFDACSGGAGNSDKLSNSVLVDTLIDISINNVRTAASATDLFDKFTLRYEDGTDFVTAMDWMGEYKSSKASTAGVAAIFPNDRVTTSSKHEIEAHLFSLGAVPHAAFFSDSDYRTWTNYEPATFAKIKQHLAYNGIQCDLCIVSPGQYIPVNSKMLLTGLGSWNVLRRLDSFPVNGIYPIAVVDDVLYFTDDRTSANLNENWGQGNIFKVHFTGHLQTSALSIQFDPNNDVIFYLDNRTSRKITSNELYGLVRAKNNFIDRFINAIPDTETSIRFVYEDQYLKNRASIIIALQFIAEMAKEIQSRKANISSVSAELKTEKYNPHEHEKYSVDSIYRSMYENAREGEAMRFLEEWELQMEEIGLAADTKFTELQFGEQVHWRELNISCGGCELTVSPNGGFLNEWKFDKFPDRPEWHMDDNAYVDMDSRIPLYKEKDIKYDMQLSGCGN